MTAASSSFASGEVMLAAEGDGGGRGGVDCCQWVLWCLVMCRSAHHDDSVSGRSGPISLHVVRPSLSLDKRSEHASGRGAFEYCSSEVSQVASMEAAVASASSSSCRSSEWKENHNIHKTGWRVWPSERQRKVGASADSNRPASPCRPCLGGKTRHAETGHVMEELPENRILDVGDESAKIAPIGVNTMRHTRSFVRPPSPALPGDTCGGSFGCQARRPPRARSVAGLLAVSKPPSTSFFR